MSWRLKCLPLWLYPLNDEPARESDSLRKKVKEVSSTRVKDYEGRRKKPGHSISTAVGSVEYVGLE
jgi:hypothetical protein